MYYYNALIQNHFLFLKISTTSSISSEWTFLEIKVFSSHQLQLLISGMFPNIGEAILLKGKLNFFKKFCEFISHAEADQAIFFFYNIHQ